MPHLTIAVPGSKSSSSAAQAPFWAPTYSHRIPTSRRSSTASTSPPSPLRYTLPPNPTAVTLHPSTPSPATNDGEMETVHTAHDVTHPRRSLGSPISLYLPPTTTTTTTKPQRREASLYSLSNSLFRSLDDTHGDGDVSSFVSSDSTASGRDVSSFIVGRDHTIPQQQGRKGVELERDLENWRGVGKERGVKIPLSLLGGVGAGVGVGGGYERKGLDLNTIRKEYICPWESFSPRRTAFPGSVAPLPSSCGKSTPQYKANAKCTPSSRRLPSDPEKQPHYSDSEGAPFSRRRERFFALFALPPWINVLALLFVLLLAVNLLIIDFRPTPSPSSSSSSTSITSTSSLNMDVTTCLSLYSLFEANANGNGTGTFSFPCSGCTAVIEQEMGQSGSGVLDMEEARVLKYCAAVAEE